MEGRQRSLSYRGKIFEAIRKGDAARARRSMAEHLSNIEKEFVEILFRSPAPSSEKAEVDEPKEVVR